jgi:hypothetical protein
MNEDYIVTFYFSSGEMMNVTYSKEKLDAMLIALRKSWNVSCMSYDEFGINFSHVTHYIVKSNKD